LGRTRPNHFGLGRRCQPIKQWTSPLFTCDMNSGEENAEEGGGGRGGGSWPAVAAIVSGDAGGEMAMASGDGPSSSLLYFSAFFFSFLPLFFSSFFLLVFSSFPLLFCSFLLPSSLVFIGKNWGRDGRGDHCTAAPGPSMGCVPSVFHRLVVGHGSEFMQVGLWSASFSCFRRKREKKAGEKKSYSSPASCVQGKKKTYSAVQNGIVSGFFLKKWTVDETALFLPKCALSFKWKLAPKRVRFKLRPSIRALFSFWSLGSNFFN